MVAKTQCHMYHIICLNKQTNNRLILIRQASVSFDSGIIKFATAEIQIHKFGSTQFPNIFSRSATCS